MATFFVSIGSNVEREHYVKAGLVALEKAFGELTLSSLFACEAVGFEGPEFYNMVISAKTSLTIDSVVTTLKAIEVDHGRAIDAKKFSPRTLDLDLLLFDDLMLETPAQIPRHEITENAFVLWPLSEIAPKLEHPILKINYQALWLAYDKSHQKLAKVDFIWPNKLTT
jgi:2-amino-4-hydroxy-6-hydroxymethyldihydropteridine diphosphokinase